VSSFVKQVLDLEVEKASQIHGTFASQYPVVITRSVERARTWSALQNSQPVVS
jgi:hypothetical protein